MLQQNLTLGFSLIEVVISISLLSLLTLGMISILNGGSTRLQLLTKIYKQQSLPLDAFAIFDWDFTHFYSPLFTEKWLDKGNSYGVKGGRENISRTERMIKADLLKESRKLFNEMKNYIYYTLNQYIVPNYFGEENKSFIFLTLSFRPRSLTEKQSFFHWVEYRCVEKKLTRKSLSMNIFTQEGLNFDLIPEEILLDNLEQCQFEYWYVAEKNFVNNIDMLKPPSAYILRAVKISFVHEGKSYERIFRPLQERMNVEEESSI